MKRSSIILTLSIAALILMMSVSFTFAATDGSAVGYTLGENGVSACEEFGIPEYDVFFTDSIDSLRNALDTAEERAEESQSMFMVYMVPGDYTAQRSIHVPENVILVGEKDTKYTCTNTSPSYHFLVSGSVYGGTFVGNNKLSGKKGRVFLFEDKAFSAPNGIVKNTYTSKAGWSGIEARGTSTSGCQVIGNTVRDCNGNGVRSIGGSTIALIEGNDISGSGQAGIDITKANVGTIKDNYIHNVTGHGISTDTEQVFDSREVKNTCVIQNVIDNTIIDTGTHGIYLEDNCHIKGTMSGNKIGKCGKCALGTHPKTTIGKMENNELYSAKLSVFGLSGKATMGDGNIIRNGKAAGIAISKGGNLNIKGKNNKIYKNKKNGIQLVESCSLKMTGKRNYIYSNQWGINLAKKCRATIKNADIYSNKKGAIYCRKGSSFTKSGCKIKGKVYKQK